MSFVEAIARKRDGHPLDRGEIADLVRGASSGSLPPEQLAAMLMAVCCRGMSEQETAWLTAEMLHSGELWKLAADCPQVVDKHSTGGVGDTVSLVLAPLLVAVGTPVAMMAGRGLGHSQGTLDKLQAIPGFCFDRNRREVLELLDQCGAAMVAQTEEIAPADRVLYALRDITGTVPSLPLIVGSIMSKKLALGASALVLDIKWGSGAFRKTEADANQLGLALRGVAREMGLACEALITDMNQPLCRSIGTACEVRAARQVLDGGGDQALREVTLRLCEEVLVLRGQQRQPARAALELALADGSAVTAWEEMVTAHGGNPDPDCLARPLAEVEVTADRPGWVTSIATEDLGWVAVELGAGRRTRDEELAFAAGLEAHARLGDQVETGQPLSTIMLGERAVDGDRLAHRVRQAFTIGDQPTQAPPLILGPVEAPDDCGG
jgi:pyrimidine-nucleoside phosphorylase